jgi:hypothetical protein
MAGIRSAFELFEARQEFSMTYSTDLRWRGIVLMYVYSIDTVTIASARTIGP